MYISVRELKSQLSTYLARVHRGETFVITARRKPLAQLGPMLQGEAAELTAVRWNGGKPRHFREIRGKARLKGNRAARAVLEGRR